jgi:hypothetical protein
MMTILNLVHQIIALLRNVLTNQANLASQVKVVQSGLSAQIAAVRSLVQQQGEAQVLTLAQITDSLAVIEKAVFYIPGPPVKLQITLGKPQPQK